MAMDFPSTPTVGQKYPATPIAGIPTYTWDGEKWTTIPGPTSSKTPVYTDGSTPMTAQLTVLDPPVASTNAASKNYVDARIRFDAAQALTSAQRSQARANIGSYKNYIINGGMMIQQGNVPGLTATMPGYWAADMWVIAHNGSGTPTFTAPLSYTPGGSPSRLRVVATAADATVAAADYVFISQSIEGLRMTDTKFGTPQAKTITLQFGVRAPAGTYHVSFNNGDFNRNYIMEYVIAPGEANTDVVRSFTVALDQTGTWNGNNTGAFNINWGLVVGSNRHAAKNVWQAGNFNATASQFNLMGTAGNTWELFDVSLVEGIAAPPFVLPDYISELRLCQRYFETVNGIGFGYWGDVVNAGGYRAYGTFKVAKRAVPTMYGESAYQYAFPVTVGTLTASLENFNEQRAANSAAAPGAFQTNIWASARIG